MEHAAADPPPGAQQAGRTQSWETPQDGTGDNYIFIPFSYAYVLLFYIL